MTQKLTTSKLLEKFEEIQNEILLNGPYNVEHSEHGQVDYLCHATLGKIERICRETTTKKGA